MNSLVQLFNGNLIAGELFHLLGKVSDFFLPLDDVLGTLHLGQIHDVHGNIFAQNLVCLLLAVAGGFTDVHISNPEEGAGLAQSCADGSLDQGAGSLGQNGLAVGNPELGAAAQTGDDTVGSDDNFIGNIDTEGTEDLTACLLGFDQLGGTDAVNFGDNQIPEIHSIGAIFLGKENVTDSGGQNLTQQVVVLQIHTQVFPHFYIVGHRKPPHNFVLLS